MSKAPLLYMESTEIAAERTAAEVTGVLVAAGARHIAMDYGDGGKIVGMHFVLIVAGLPYPFKMPVRTEPVFKIINGRRRSPFDKENYAAKDLKQAERVAWRQLLRWVQAQIAMIDAGMVEAREIFAPYLLDQSGRTLFECLEETRFRALPQGKGA